MYTEPKSSTTTSLPKRNQVSKTEEGKKRKKEQKRQMGYLKSATYLAITKAKHTKEPSCHFTYHASSNPKRARKQKISCHPVIMNA